MKPVKSARSIIYTCVIFVLVGALIASLAVIRKKDKTLKEKTEYISSTQSKIAENEKKIAEYEAQIAEKDKKNSEISSKLTETQKSKKKLEEENASLKKKIETLSAQKKAVPTPAVIYSPQAVSTSGNKVCYLTFDDGPSANTLKILDTLKQYGAKATFFVISTANFNYVKRICDEGHTVGLHSASHVYSSIYKSTDAYFADLKAISDRVESITGVKSKVIRFPGGSSNLVSASHCKGIMTKLVKQVGEQGYSYFDWNVSSGDAESKTASATKIINNVLSGAQNKNSICVLMHDSGAKTTTAQALPQIIEGLTRMGFKFEGLKPESYGYHHEKLNN